MRELLEKRHPPLDAAIKHAVAMEGDGELTADEVDAFIRLVGRDHCLDCMEPEDHAAARQKGGLIDQIAEQGKLSADGEELARRAEIKVAASLLSMAVDNGHLDAKAARDALALLVDMTDHDNAAGDHRGSLSSVSLLSILVPESLKPAPSKSTAARDAPDAVTAQEADQFKRRNRR